MSVTYTYGQLQSQIAYELGQRFDLMDIPSGSNLALSPIQQAIQNAIAKWEREHFYFNEQGALQTFTSDQIVTETGSGFLTEDGQAVVVESTSTTGNFLTESGAVITTESGSAISVENPGSGGGPSTKSAVMTSLATVTGQEFYDQYTWAYLLSSIHIDKIWVFISGNRYSLNPRTEQYMSDTSLNPNVTGQPIDYSYYAEAIRLYPIPNGVYPITIEGTRRYSTLVNSTDANVWTQDAADLIKAEAKRDIYMNTLKDKAQADGQSILIYGDPGNAQDVGFIHALRSEGVQRPAVLKAKGWYF